MVLREHVRRERPDATEAELDALVAQRMVALHDNEFSGPPFRQRPIETFDP